MKYQHAYYYLLVTHKGDKSTRDSREVHKAYGDHITTHSKWPGGLFTTIIIVKCPGNEVQGEVYFGTPARGFEVSTFQFSARATHLHNTATMVLRH